MQSFSESNSKLQETLNFLRFINVLILTHGKERRCFHKIQPVFRDWFWSSKQSNKVLCFSHLVLCFGARFGHLLLSSCWCLRTYQCLITHSFSILFLMFYDTRSSPWLPEQKWECFSNNSERIWDYSLSFFHCYKGLRLIHFFLALFYLLFLLAGSNKFHEKAWKYPHFD